MDDTATMRVDLWLYIDSPGFISVHGLHSLDKGSDAETILNAIILALVPPSNKVATAARSSEVTMAGVAATPKEVCRRAIYSTAGVGEYHKTTRSKRQRPDVQQAGQMHSIYQ